MDGNARKYALLVLLLSTIYEMLLPLQRTRGKEERVETEGGREREVAA